MDCSGSTEMSPSGYKFGSVTAFDSSRIHLGDNNYYRTSDEEQLLNSLPNATQAVFNSYERRDDPLCLRNTRVDLLNEIRAWADGQDERCIFWLNGWAGTGKSTIARTIAREYHDRNSLGASFFFSRGGGDVGHARMFFTSIAVQLAYWSPVLKGYICEAVAKHNNIAYQALGDQWAQLVLGPLLKLKANSSRPLLVLVVDALDECDGSRDIQAIVQLLAQVRSLSAVRIRVLITTRPEVPINDGFDRISNADHQVFVLHQISPSLVNHDLSILLEHNFGEMRKDLNLPEDWPGELAMDCLVRKSGGLFIWAATTCRFIRDGRQYAEMRLLNILEGSITGPEKALDEIYTIVLRNSVQPNFDEQEKEYFYENLRLVLGTVVTLLSTLSASSLASLLHLRKHNIDQTLESLHSILDLPREQDWPIRLHHQSFRDFLLGRCGDDRFRVDQKRAHRALAHCCMQLMFKRLRKDICGLGVPGALASEVQHERIEQCLPAELRYACQYWVQHLRESDARLYDNGDVHVFLQKHFQGCIQISQVKSGGIT